MYNFLNTFLHYCKKIIFEMIVIVRDLKLLKQDKEGQKIYL